MNKREKEIEIIKIFLSRLYDIGNEKENIIFKLLETCLNIIGSTFDFETVDEFKDCAFKILEGCLSELNQAHIDSLKQCKQGNPTSGLKSFKF